MGARTDADAQASASWSASTPEEDGGFDLIDEQGVANPLWLPCPSGADLL